MKTTLQQAIDHLKANMNGIGIVMNESGLTAKEKRHYTTNYECLKITKEYLEKLLPTEKQQIIDARVTAPILNSPYDDNYTEEAEQYYKETYEPLS